MKSLIRLIKRILSGMKLKRLDSKDIPNNKNEIRLFLIVRNESLRLPYFFKYYKKLGVVRFFVVDNNSTDDTVKFLLKQKNTHVFETKERFDRQAERIDYMLHRYGVGYWCVVVDADEFLRYPHSEKINLKQISKFLDGKEYDALHCLLLDMYSNKPLRLTYYKKGSNPLLVTHYFDLDSHVKYKDFIEGSGRCKFKGGFRDRVFGLSSASLSKYPLIKFKKKMYILWGAHQIEGASVSKIEGVVLHFKFFSDFILRISEEAKREEHWNNAKQYKIYNSKTRKDSSVNFYYSKSTRFKDNNQLIRLGIMKTSKEFESYVKNCEK
ncbi:MAG: glycosyltransferase family 2 protein [DPANN group archaeon]|nr:glycosyltransferase family 2 protein [DPANN group archaeon]